MTPHIYTEIQRFRQVWIWTILLAVTGIAAGTMGYELFRNPQVSLGELILPIGILLFVNGLFLSMKLTTRFDTESISYSYFPFLGQRKYDWAKIESIELITYNGLFEYGGWGIKWNGDCWSYTTGGTHGILVKTKDKKFLLGTQNPEKAREAIVYFMEIKSSSHGL
jgi:hypothetical protein